MKRVSLFADTKKKIFEGLEKLSAERFLSIDTETSGLNSHSNFLWSIQLGNERGDFGLLIPVNLFFDKNNKPEKWLSNAVSKLLTNDSVTSIAHNYKFDIQFLNNNDIEVGNIYCSAIGEKILTAGKLGVRNDLNSVLKRRFGIQLNKENRKDFYDGTAMSLHQKDPKSLWSQRLIDYSLEDIYDLPRVMKLQLKEIKQWKLQDTLALEMDVLRVTSKMENNGIGIDAEGCRVFQMDMAKRAEETLVEVLRELQPVWEKVWRKQYAKDIAKWDAWAICKKLIVKQTNKRVNGKLTAEAVQERAKMDSVKPFSSKPKEKGVLKLRSANPMKGTILAYCGLALLNTAKETMEQFRVEYPILEQILEYKKYAKLSEFGELYEKIDSITGRIHSSYNQIVSTGRFSSSSPNLQQIPSRTEEGVRLRALFQSREGYKFVGADFAGIELIILGVLGKDKVLLDAVNSGKDVHCFTISNIINASYETVVNAKEGQPYDYDLLVDSRKAFEQVFDLPLVSSSIWDEKGLRGWIKALRNDIKTLSYGVAYQLSKYGLARKFHCLVDNAELFIDTFFGIYSGVGHYVNSIGEIGYEKGYAETKLGRKRFFRNPKIKNTSEIIKELTARLKKEKINIDALTNEEWNYYVREAIKIHKQEVKSQISAIKREAGNMPIQGMSADITKLAMVLFDGYLMEAGVFEEDEALILVVHDELIAECRDENTELCASLLKRAMTEAAHYFLGKNVLILVSPYVDSYWKKN